MEALVPPMEMGERTKPPPAPEKKKPPKEGASSDRKMDVDFTINVDESIARAEGMEFSAALAELMGVEKRVRLGQQGESTTKVLVAIVRMCERAQKWVELNEYVVVLSKKRSQIKQAIAKMVQEAMTYIPRTPDLDTRIALIQTLRGVTEGKIYVEVERAHLIRTLAQIREKQGDVAAASDLLQQVQIETIGTMDDKEKIDFILETMRLTLARGDAIRTYIISKKITSRAIARAGLEELKVRYYTLLVEYWEKGNTPSNYLEMCRCYYNIYNTSGIPNPHEVLEKLALFVVLSPYGNEQDDLLNRIFREKRLQELRMQKFRSFLKLFTRTELIVWSGMLVPEVIEDWLSAHPVFTDDPARIETLRNIVVEHNARVVSKFYTRIEIPRLTFLLGTTSDLETETVISKLVVEGTIHAKIDRIDRIVQFKLAKQSGPDHEVLNGWSSEVGHILGLVGKVTHLIAKERMVLGTQQEAGGRRGRRRRRRKKATEEPEAEAVGES